MAIYCVSYSRDDFQQGIEQRLPQPCSEEQLARALRLFRRRELVRIIWRDFSRLATMPETTRELSWMAEAAITCALQQLHPLTCGELGTPFSEPDSQTPREQNMVVIAMGKMGAEELNMSSDIDLIFAYPDKGETRRIDGTAGKTVSNQEFFTRLGQRLIAALDRQTAEGFVFRVDMRLRPYGQSGALVLSFDALEEYYTTQGSRMGALCDGQGAGGSGQYWRYSPIRQYFASLHLSQIPRLWQHRRFAGFETHYQSRIEAQRHVGQYQTWPWWYP